MIIISSFMYHNYKLKLEEIKTGRIDLKSMENSCINCNNCIRMGYKFY